MLPLLAFVSGEFAIRRRSVSETTHGNAAAKRIDQAQQEQGVLHRCVALAWHRRANGADQSFDERMRNGRVRNRLDLLDLEYAQVGEPAVESKQRIVVGTQVLRRRLAGNGVIEHPTYGYAVNVSGFDTEADDATCEHVHHDHDPVTPQEYGFASEQVDAPEAILDLPDKCKPGRAVSSGVTRPVVLREHAADNILVNLDAEGMSDLLRDADTAELGIAALRLDDCRNKLGGWTSRARLSSQG